MQLNREQAEAAALVSGPGLIVAGAGTGKTATLAARLASLVEAGIPAEEILLLTFTRRAAFEMIERANNRLGELQADFSGGTFHSFAAATLRRFATQAGLPETFTILDQADSSRILSELRAESPLARKKKAPQTRTIGAILSRAVNTQRPIGVVIMDEHKHYLHWAPAIEDIAKAFVSRKVELGVVDFDDLLHVLIRVLRDCPGVLSEVQDRWRYFMVDEYQDTNVLQAEIVELLGGRDGNVVVVGDDAQSIYAFRGARYENLRQFAQRFRGCKRITLEQNYRSSQAIIRLSNAVLKQMHSAFRKQLRTDREEGTRPVLVRASSSWQEANFVADAVQAYHRAGLPLADMAVLFRGSRHAFTLESELRRRKIPFVKYGGLQFVEYAHVKDMISLMRLLANSQDKMSLRRVLAWAPGVGAKRQVQLERDLQGEFTTAALSGLRVPGQAADFFDNLAPRVDGWRRLAESPPAALLEQLTDYYQPLMEERFDDWPKRLKDLEVLQGMAADAGSLSDFLVSLALDPPDRFGADDEVVQPGDRLVLSTIHSSKGLEWSRVFVLGLCDGVLPLTFDQSDAALEEELRLLYVAVTRAADELVLSWYESGKQGPNNVSRFMRPISHAVLSRKTLPGAGKTSPRGRHAGDWRQDVEW